jgi:hypothetical protein
VVSGLVPSKNSGCLRYAVSLCKQITDFWRNVLLASSGSSNPILLRLIEPQDIRILRSVGNYLPVEMPFQKNLILSKSAVITKLSLLFYSLAPWFRLVTGLCKFNRPHYAWSVSWQVLEHLPKTGRLPTSYILLSLSQSYHPITPVLGVRSHTWCILWFHYLFLSGEV